MISQLQEEDNDNLSGLSDLTHCLPPSALNEYDLSNFKVTFSIENDEP